MNLVSTGAFDRLQQALAAELLRTIETELEEVDAPEDLVEHLTGSIGFSTMRQGSRRMAKAYRAARLRSSADRRGDG